MSAPVWIDSHAHLAAPDFDADRPAVLERARAARVEAIVVVGSGWGVASGEAALALARAAPDLHPTVGVHPHDASALDSGARERLERWLDAPEVVAVGECGLDYYYERSPREVQRRVLAEQLGWARERALPVVLHVRDRDGSAWREFFEIWSSEGSGLEGVLHCFTGSYEHARRGLDLGLSISFSGILTFRKDTSLREVARRLPLDRLLVETDSPLLAPEGHRGRRNEPAYLPRVGEVLAEVFGVDPETVAARTRAEARRLFRLPGG